MKQFFMAMAFGLTAAALHAGPLPAPVDDSSYRAVSMAEARLGHLLFYDPILSGNKTVACATCHHPKFGTGDGLSLGFGDGGIGLGPDRQADPDNMPIQRIPRNAPSLFNLGAHEFQVMFHDGRLEADATKPSGIRTPMGEDMVQGFASVLAAQTMFPVLSRDEMAGDYNENELGKLIRQGRITGAGGAWDVLARRVAEIPAYADAFVATYPHVSGPEDIAFTDISNAIAVFMEHEWRSDTAPFDDVLRGKNELAGPAARGLELFYGELRCARCHAGPFLTDHRFHAMGDPQIGPGKSATFEDHYRDDGRFRVTGDPGDRYAFRTPSLRNVMLTAPYGHAGAYSDLRAYLAHHSDPVAGLASYSLASATLPAFSQRDDAILRDNGLLAEIAQSATQQPQTLSPNTLDDLVAFLETLTDPVAIEGRLGVPDAVPSGLPVP